MSRTVVLTPTINFKVNRFTPYMLDYPSTWDKIVQTEFSGDNDEFVSVFNGLKWSEFAASDPEFADSFTDQNNLRIRSVATAEIDIEPMFYGWGSLYTDAEYYFDVNAGVDAPPYDDSYGRGSTSTLYDTFGSRERFNAVEIPLNFSGYTVPNSWGSVFPEIDSYAERSGKVIYILSIFTDDEYELDDTVLDFGSFKWNKISSQVYWSDDSLARISGIAKISWTLSKTKFKFTIYEISGGRWVKSLDPEIFSNYYSSIGADLDSSSLSISKFKVISDTDADYEVVTEPVRAPDYDWREYKATQFDYKTVQDGLPTQAGACFIEGCKWPFDRVGIDGTGLINNNGGISGYPFATSDREPLNDDGDIPAYGLSRFYLDDFDPYLPIIAIGSFENDGNFYDFHKPLHEIYKRYFWLKYLNAYYENTLNLLRANSQYVNFGGSSIYNYFHENGYSYENYDEADAISTLYPYPRYEVVSWAMDLLDFDWNAQTQIYDNTVSYYAPWVRDAGYTNSLSSLNRSTLWDNLLSNENRLIKYNISESGSGQVSSNFWKTFLGQSFNLFDVEYSINEQDVWFINNFSLESWIPELPYHMFKNTYFVRGDEIPNSSSDWNQINIDYPPILENTYGASYTGSLYYPSDAISVPTKNSFIKVFPSRWWGATQQKIESYKDENHPIAIQKQSELGAVDALVNQVNGIGDGTGGISQDGRPYIDFWIYPGQSKTKITFVQINPGGMSDWIIGTIGM